MTDIAKDEVHLVATLTAKPERTAALITALERIIPDVRKEAGCLRYDLHVDRENPATVFMLETWKDDAALAAHAAAAPFQWLTGQLGDLLATPLTLQKLQRIA